MAAAVAAGASVVSGIMGFKGNMAAAKNAEPVAEYNAQVEKNELVLRQREKANQDARLRQQSDRLAGTQRVATAKSGIQMSGSALQALADTYFNTEIDALRIQYSSDIDQTRTEASAALTRAEGKARGSALRTKAYQSLLEGGSQAYSAGGFGE